KAFGRPDVQYKLRDWVFSRQHYWGEPIPIVHCSEHGAVPVPEDQLPVELPYVEKYQPSGTGESPLASVKDWVNTKCPQCGQPAKRETDTMPNWAGSSWYYLRYCDPKNDREFAELAKLRYWLPVDLYNGGMEHTTLHLLYSRFWHKFLFDEGLVTTSEPYQRRHSHGIVLAEDGRKMSKSFGNVINPDDYVREYGADSLRMYEMFMGPFEDTIPWSTNGLVGVRRFLNRVYLVLSALKEKKPELEDKPGLSKLIHKTVKKVTDDFTDLKFNTAVSTMMEYLNARDFALKLNREGVFEGNEVDWPAVKKYLILLYPMAPHLASDLFEMLFESDINSESWPEYDEKKLKAETFQLVIQVNGKVRAKIEAPTDIDEKHAVELAQDDSVWLRYLEGRTYRVVFVPNRLINFIVS
ncbi:MAG: Leucine-tRNA ligase, partial [Candidatus Giovannonibacteria bacterium GW2011_GWA2_53_7]